MKNQSSFPSGTVRVQEVQYVAYRYVETVYKYRQCRSRAPGESGGEKHRPQVVVSVVMSCVGTRHVRTRKVFQESTE